jgi:hypothetical protein
MCFDSLLKPSSSSSPATTATAAPASSDNVKYRKDPKKVKADIGIQYGVALKHGKYRDMFHDQHKKNDKIFSPGNRRKKN